MTAINDLDPCRYFPFECDALRAVGWLGAGLEYARGEVLPAFFEKLEALCASPWEPVTSAGWHECELCPSDAPTFHRNVFIPFDGCIYAAPVGVVHYIAAHCYRPPDEFIQAVLACPPMHSAAYFEELSANGERSLLDNGGH